MVVFFFWSRWGPQQRWMEIGEMETQGEKTWHLVSCGAGEKQKVKGPLS